jgi:predicted flavoprotein YhiN
VDVYDSMPSVGRKFLMAGRGGLNLTHSEPFEVFLTSATASRREEIEPLLKRFGADDVRAWVHPISGSQTFVSAHQGRVFPMGMKASPLLRAWLGRLTDSGVTFHSASSNGLGCAATSRCSLKRPMAMLLVNADAIVLALGGGSWAQTRLGRRVG